MYRVLLKIYLNCFLGNVPDFVIDHKSSNSVNSPSALLIENDFERFIGAVYIMTRFLLLRGPGPGRRRRSILPVPAHSFIHSLPDSLLRRIYLIPLYSEYNPVLRGFMAFHLLLRLSRQRDLCFFPAEPTSPPDPRTESTSYPSVGQPGGWRLSPGRFANFRRIKRVTRTWYCLHPFSRRVGPCYKTHTSIPLRLPPRRALGDWP